MGAGTRLSCNYEYRVTLNNSSTLRCHLLPKVLYLFRAAKAMYFEGMWIRSELFTHREVLIGSVRLRHGPDWSLRSRSIFQS